MCFYTLNFVLLQWRFLFEDPKQKRRYQTHICVTFILNLSCIFITISRFGASHVLLIPQILCHSKLFSPPSVSLSVGVKFSSSFLPLGFFFPHCVVNRQSCDETTTLPGGSLSAPAHTALCISIT